jgi:prepilin-type N-terminal cleavage/methylation domain-containing protein
MPTLESDATPFFMSPATASSHPIGKSARPACGPVVRGGFTIIELLIVVVIISVLSSMAYPPIAESVAASRTENAARIVATDLRYAMSLASRKGTPVVVEFDNTNLRLRITDRVSGAVLHERLFTAKSEFPIASATASPASVQVFPSRSTSAQLTITLSTPVRSNRVTLTRAGLVRIERL